jgi:hypothetical protein
MSQTDDKIDTLSQLLEGFIQRQEVFNTHIEKKIDKTQYFLEEYITNTAKMFIEEQTKQAAHIRMLDDEVANLKSNLYELSLQIRTLQKT